MQMYTIAGYGSMIADRVRMDAFARVLRQAVTPGSVVLDIGTGTGIWALLACRYGARRVYAIEPDDAIQVAREIAAANGYAERIEFIQAVSTAVTLPERADVIVSDLGGVLPWFQQHIPSIVDARRRLLARGGVLIPRRDTAWAVIVEAPRLYEEYTTPWEDGYGFDMTAARRLVTNTWNRGRVTPDQQLATTQDWAVIDYAVVKDPDVRASVTWTVTRPGTGHGFAAGFRRVVGEGALLSNAPDAPDSIRPENIYGTVFFPWSEPVPLATGDTVTVDLQARLVGDDYVWTWNTQVRPAGQPDQVLASFQQSTLFGVPLSAARLRKRASRHVPSLTGEGQAARLALASMDASVSLAEIARRVTERFPDRFPTAKEALAYVADLSQRYSRDPD